MLKKLLSIICIFMVIGAAKAQTFQITPSDTLRIDTTVSANNAHIVEIFYLKNNSNTDTLKMKWRVTLNTFPHSDTFSVCDPTNCWSSLVFQGNTISYTFLPQQTGLMKFDYAPLCATKSGILRIHTWASNDSANTVADMTWIYNVTAQCASGINDINPAQISLYPNPVKDEMKISLPASMDNGQIDIYNLIGSKVYSQYVGKGKEIDLSALESGLYVARISENGKVIATKKFTKTE